MKVLLCGFAVVIAGGKRSVSFSNLVAKPCGVDGTASWWVWESRWLPQFFCEWGSPSVGGPSFFVPQGGVWVCGVLVLVLGVLRACVGVFGGLHKKARAIRRLVSSPPYEKHDITICIKAYICVVK